MLVLRIILNYAGFRLNNISPVLATWPVLKIGQFISTAPGKSLIHASAFDVTNTLKMDWNILSDSWNLYYINCIVMCRLLLTKHPFNLLNAIIRTSEFPLLKRRYSAQTQKPRSHKHHNNCNTWFFITGNITRQTLTMEPSLMLHHTRRQETRSHTNQQHNTRSQEHTQNHHT